MNPRPAQVRIHQHHRAAGLGDGQGQIGDQGRFAVPHVRTGHLDQLVLLALGAEEHRGADAAVGLGLKGVGAVVAAQRGINAITGPAAGPFTLPS